MGVAGVNNKVASSSPGRGRGERYGLPTTTMRALAEKSDPLLRERSPGDHQVAGAMGQEGGERKRPGEESKNRRTDEERRNQKTNANNAVTSRERRGGRLRK